VDKAHVQHLVGLVQHQKAGGIQRQRPAFQQVDQPARGGDQNVGPARQQFGLLRRELLGGPGPAQVSATDAVLELAWGHGNP